MSKEGETYSADMLRRFKQISDGTPPSEVLEAEEVIAEFRKKQAEARAAIARFSQPLPHPDSCPECFYRHGRDSRLIAAPHPDPSKFDRMRCRSCSYIEDRDVRP